MAESRFMLQNLPFLNTKFLVLNTQFLVFNATFLIITPCEAALLGGWYGWCVSRDGLRHVISVVIKRQALWFARLA